MADLLITDADRDSLLGAGLLLGTIEGSVTFRVVSSLPEVTRLLHDARRAYTRVLICGVAAAPSGSLRSTLTVLQARGTRVWWFDSHELLWTDEIREQLDRLGVEVRLPDPHRPETERTVGLVLAHLLDSGNPRASRSRDKLRATVAEARRVEMEGPDWLALVDAIQHDHRLLTQKAIKSAILRVWDTDAPLAATEQKLVALQRSREMRVERFLTKLAEKAEEFQQLLRFDAEEYKELRYIRPYMYTDSARKRLGAEYAQARVGRGWTYACRDPYRSGLDLPVAFLERLPDLDVTVHGYPFRSTVRVQGGLDVDERLMKVLEIALEEERTGRRQVPSFIPLEEQDIDW